MRNQTLKMGRFALVALAATGLVACENYDTLIQKDQVCQQRWADIDAQLQRRSDLIPNIVSTVKGSAQHEEKTLTEVIQARSQATSIKLTAEDTQDPAKLAAFQKAQDNLKGALSRLLVVQEQYPDLKANAAFHDLQVELEGTENRVLRAREVYNAAVGDYNAELGKIRGKIVKRVTGGTFQPRPYFTASADSKIAPKVTF